MMGASPGMEAITRRARVRAPSARPACTCNAPQQSPPSRGNATPVSEAETGHNAQGVTFTPDGKHVLVQNYVEGELAVYKVSPTAIETSMPRTARIGPCGPR